MSILRRRQPERRYSGGAFFPSDYIPSNGMAPYVASSYGGSSDQAMRHAPVYACVRIVSDVVSTCSVDAYVGDPGLHLGEAERVTPKPTIITRPSQYLSGVQWVHQVMMSLLLQGNAYGMIAETDRNGYPTQIDLMDPASVTVQRSLGNDVNTATGRRITAGAKVFKVQGSTLTSEQVWHCPGPMMPGDLAGLSPVKYASRVIGMGVEAEQFGLDFFRNGVHPTAVAASDQFIDQEDAETIKSRIKAAVAARDVAVLGAGLELKPWMTSPEDALLIEVQRMNAVNVCQIFGVPPEMIGANAPGASITYANREQRAQDFVANAINPWLTRLEDSFSALFPRTTFVKFDTAAFLKSDLSARYNAWSTGIAAGFLLPEEAREFEDLPDVALPEPVAPMPPPDPNAMPAAGADTGETPA